MNPADRKTPSARAYAALRRWMRLVVPLVPPVDRPRWLEEWEGELWYGVASRPDPIRWSLACGIGLDVLSDALHLRMRRSGAGVNRMVRRFARGLFSEVRVAMRGARNAPGFAAAVACTLGLGVGAAVTTFSVVDSLLLSPLPYPDAERTVSVWQARPAANLDRDWLSAAEFVDIQKGTRSFDLLALIRGFSATLVAREAPTRIGCVEASSAFMGIIGARAAVGRVLDEGDDSAGAPTVAVISYGLWQRAFGGEENVIGRIITIGEEQTEIVGVFGPDLLLDSDVLPTVGNIGHVDVVRSLRISPELSRDRSLENYNILGRLRPGTSVRQAQVELDLVSRHLRESYSNYADSGFFIYAIPLLDQVVGNLRRALFVLFAAVGGLLLIACVNVANLLLARASTRKKEMGIRAAMGAERFRLVRQLLTESALLAALGGLLGVVLAFGGVAAVRRFGAASLPRVTEIGIDGKVLAFSCAITALTVLIFGLVPAWRMSTVNVTGALKAGGAGAVGTGSLWSRSRLSNALVAAEIGLSLVLLIGGGLLVRSFLALQRVDPGFRTSGELTFHVQLSGASYDPKAARLSFYDRLIERLGSLPGVEAVGGVSCLPFGGGISWGPVEIDGHVPETGGKNRIISDLRFTLPGYFETMEIPLVRGRLFDGRDRAELPWSMVIDENFADTYFPDRDPIGTTVRFWGGREATIVGVVGNVKQYALDDEPRTAAYLPERQVGARGMYVVIRSPGYSDELAAKAAKTVHDLDSEIAIVGMTPMRARLSQSLATRRFSTTVLQLFGVVALLLATVGVYGVVSSRVNHGVRELGLRVALGAPARRILALVLEQGLVLGSVGVGMGLTTAVASTRLLRSMLFGVSSLDGITFASMSTVLLSATVLACYLPARRATRIDPLEVLRTE